MPIMTPERVMQNIAKGSFVPHTGLSNMGLAYFQNEANYFAKALFPICPVDLSSDIYYRFSKEDLLRDDWARKPAYGQVQTSHISEDTDTYNCQVDQIIMGIDQIRQTDLKRRQGNSLARDPRQQRAKAIAEKANIHQDRLFANAFFKSGVWNNEYTGVDEASATGKQFVKFTNGNSDPIKFIADLKAEIFEQTGREPNRLGIGANVLKALRVHEGILERVKYGGTTPNPAKITEKVLAELFEVEKLVVCKSIENKAKLGAAADMSYIGDPNAMLLTYATNSPAVDEPSAGYIFTWDMLGNGQMMPIMHRVKNDATHSEEIEGLMATDMKKTADDLAAFCANVV